MGKVTKVTTRKTTMVWLLNHAKGDVNLHDFGTQTTALKLEHISQGGGCFECEDALSSDGMFATQLSSAAFPALCQVAALPQRYGSREPSQASYLLPPSQLTSLLERQQVQSALLNRLEFTLTKNYLFYENL